MPNTQTSVPLYAQGEVLTAANLNLTNSGIPVFATTVTRDAAFGGANEKVLAEIKRGNLSKQEAAEKIAKKIRDKFDLPVSKEEIMFWDDDPDNVKGAKEYGFNAEQYKSFKEFEARLKKDGIL